MTPLLCENSYVYRFESVGDHAPIKHDTDKEYENFELGYISVGMGSNQFSMQPVFKVKGTDYIYTMQQTYSFVGEPIASPDTVCSGKIRKTSLDSIINLVKDIPDSVIYRVNHSIMSGGIHEIWINYKDISIRWTLHNAYDPIAEQIVAILNSNLPADKRGLWVWDKSMGSQK
jgi:hypothetical protein